MNKEELIKGADPERHFTMGPRIKQPELKRVEVKEG